MKRNELVALSEISLFKDVDILELEAFFRDNVVHIRSYEEGQSIADQGEHCHSLILILDGKVGASMAAMQGKLIRLETLLGPCAAATAVLFSSHQRLPVSLRAEGPVTLLCIKEDMVLLLMQKFAPFLRAYLRENGDKLIFLAEKIRLFQFQSLRQKLIGHILLLSRQQGGTDLVKMIYSREELSQLVSVARPSLSRELSAMVKEKLIVIEGKSIGIPDMEVLKSELSS